MKAAQKKKRPAESVPEAAPKKKVFLVDDHAVVRLGMRQLLEKQPDFTVCGEAEDGRLALEAILESSPDLAIVDLSLKSGSGLELIKNLKVQMPGTTVLVLSMHDEALHAEMALRAGALGYVMKSDPPEMMLAAMRRVLGGNIYVSETLAARMLQQQVLGRREGLSSPEERLSDREMEVLQMIGEWKATRDIAQSLSISIKTVEYYREQIKNKLSLKSGTELLQYAVMFVQQNKKKKS